MGTMTRMFFFAFYHFSVTKRVCRKSGYPGSLFYKYAIN